MQTFTKPVNLDHKIEEAIAALEVHKPVCLYGPTGTGKTIAAWEVANKVAKDLKNDVIYIQMYPEITKNVIIGGETIKNGNIVVDTGPIIKLGGSETKNGATFIVDEVTHATEPALLGFNSLIEEPFQTVVGAKVHQMHENTRFIFAGNTPDHAGNVHLPASFANRLYIIDFPVPDEKSLAIILDGTVGVPEGDDFRPLQDFIISIALKSNTTYFSISPRNIINCIGILRGKAGTGFKATGNLKDIEKSVVKAMKTLNMNPAMTRNVILATMLGNTITKNDGPDKVKALVWEE